MKFFYWSFVILTASTLFGTTYCQVKLFTPKEIALAEFKNTRSVDGTPGKSFWQNKSDYKISAEVKPSSRLLEGDETISYSNNSPDTLKRIVLKLYQNFYKPEAIRNKNISKETFTNGIILESFTINNTSLDLNSPKVFNDQGTVLIIKLPEPIAPKTSSVIKVKWNFTIPSGTNIRMGTYDSTSFFAGLWFPRIAVYDDISGWDTDPYQGDNEFYNEYGNFDVKIKVPSNFGVWATGMLANAEEIFSPGILDKYHTALTSNELVNIISANDLKEESIFKNKNGFHEFHYKANEVCDFAFGLSDHYIWEGTSTKINGKNVFVNAAYNPLNKGFKDAVADSKKTIEDLGAKVTGVPYPYPQITIFNGDDGMEYPMICNDGDLKERIWDVYVTSHEISHMYFPFYVGTNEDKYAWMDEGMAYFLPLGVQNDLFPYDHRVRAAATLSTYLGKEKDMPIMTPTFFLREPDLSILVYYKPAIAYDILRDMLGFDKFKECMQSYINTWAGKHPTPYDFFYTFNSTSGKNLNWFWDSWFFGKGFSDNGIKAVRQNKNEIGITIIKKGIMPSPVYLTLKDIKGKEIKIIKQADIWESTNEITIKQKIDDKIISVDLGDLKIPDANPKDNVWKE